MFTAVYAGRKRLPWLVAIAAAAMLAGLGVLMS